MTETVNVSWLAAALTDEPLAAMLHCELPAVPEPPGTRPLDQLEPELSAR